MKSAYEIAMAKLDQSSGPSRTLSEDQKARIAEIEKRYESKIAGARLRNEDEIAAIQTLPELEQAKAAMAGEILTLEEKRDAEKDAVWNE